MLRLFKRFSADRRGNIAVMFALSSLPVMALIGAAMDFSTIALEKSQIQGYLDAAVLNAINSPSAGEAQSSIENYLANTKLAGAIVTNVAISSTATVKTLTASASVTVPSFILGSELMGGNGGTKLTASSKVTGNFKPISYTFTPLAVKGYYGKDILIWSKDETGKVISLIPVLSYNYNFTKSEPIISSPLNQPTSTFSLPYSYTTGVMMRMTYTGTQCGFTRLTCSAAGDFYSDDKKASDYLKVTGSCSDSAGATYSWEDGGGDLDFKDLVYSIKCTLSSRDVENPRLVQ